MNTATAMPRQGGVPTRGERNNNPGNIDWNQHIPWQGQIGLETPPPGERARFAVFDAAENGIRAIARILIHYQRAEHLDTVRGIVNRWAPAVENKTGAYVDDVDIRLGRRADDRLDLGDPELLGRLVAAIIHHENGCCRYDPATLAEGVRRALTTAV